MGKAKIFIAYAREDIKVKNKLQKQLKYLDWDKSAEVFCDGQINPGEVWEERLQQEISKSDIILLLLSDDFVSSMYIMNVEVPKALKRCDQGKSIVIPILVREVKLPKILSSRQYLKGHSGNSISLEKNKEYEWKRIAEHVGEKVELINLQFEAQNKGGDACSVTLLRLEQLKEELSRRLLASASVWLCSRSGIGWNKDFGKAISSLSSDGHRPSDSRFLFLDPDGEIFRLDSSMYSTDKDDFACSPDEKKHKAVTFYNELCERGHHVRVADIVLPPPFWACTDEGNQMPTEAFIEVPVWRSKHGGNLYIKADGKKEQHVKVYSQIFDDLWAQSRDWELFATT